jgi:hypothetical protein
MREVNEQEERAERSGTEIWEVREVMGGKDESARRGWRAKLAGVEPLVYHMKTTLNI